MESETRYLPGQEKPAWGEGWETPGLAEDALYGHTKCPICDYSVKWISRVSVRYLDAGIDPESEHAAFKVCVEAEINKHARAKHGAN